MPTTPEQNIYNRLSGAASYHPATASLFTDWNLQAGDVVTVKSDGTSYQLPIYNMRMKWTGKPKVEIESTGNMERKPLTANQRKDYAAGSEAYEREQEFKRYSGGGAGGLESQIAEINGILYEAGLTIDQVSGIMMYATERGDKYTIGSTFRVQSSQIESVVSKTGINELGEEETLYSRITQTESSITAVVSGLSGAYSKISITESEISAVVSGLSGAYSAITETQSQISLKVSKGDVATQLAVECGNVTISGGDLIVEGSITAEQLSTLIASIGTLKVSSVQASGNITVSGGVTAAGFYIGDSSSASSVANAVASFGSATYNEGQVTIPVTLLSGSPGTSITFNVSDMAYFQEAVSEARIYGAAHANLGKQWSKGDLTVNVSYGGSSVLQTMTVSLDSIETGEPTFSGKTVTIPCTVYEEEGTTGFTANVSANVSKVWDDGWDAAVDVTDIPVTSSGATFNVIIPSAETRGSGTTIPYTVSFDRSRQSAVVRDAIHKVAEQSVSGYLSAISVSTTGTFAPSGDYIGFSSVTVEGTSDQFNAGWRAARSMVAPPSGGQAESFTVGIPGETVGSSDSYTFTMAQGTPSSVGYVSVKLGQTGVARTSIGEWYVAGWNYARSVISLLAYTPGENQCRVTRPSNIIGDTFNYTFTVSADNSYAYIKQGGNTVAQVTNPAYANGWAAAFSKYYLDDPQTESASFQVHHPTSTVGSGTVETFAVSVDNSYAKITHAGAIYAQVSNTAYAAGVSSVSISSVVRTITWNSETTRYAITMTATASNGASKVVTGNFNPTDAKNYGWDWAQGKVSLPGAGSAGSFVVKYPKDSGGGTHEQASVTYTIFVDNDYAYVKDALHTVAKMPNSAYQAGQQEAASHYTLANWAKKGLSRYGSGATEMYVKERDRYYLAGNHCWFWASDIDFDTLYEYSS